jgi:hypothetical protein
MILLAFIESCQSAVLYVLQYFPSQQAEKELSGQRKLFINA